MMRQNHGVCWHAESITSAVYFQKLSVWPNGKNIWAIYAFASKNSTALKRLPMRCCLVRSF